MLKKMANYSKHEGKRKGSVVYVHDNFVYSRKLVCSTRVLLRCVKYQNSLCKGAATIHKANDTCELIHIHNHTHDGDEINTQRFKNELKEAAGDTTDSLRNVYNRIAAKHPLEITSQCPYKKVVSTMRRRREKKVASQQISRKQCSICLDEIEDSWVFQPCGHGRFCDTCSDRVLGETQTCAICRGNVTGKMQIFLD